MSADVKLKYGYGNDEDQPQGLSRRELRKRQAMYSLVNSPAYPELKKVAAEIVGRYAAQPAQSIQHMLSYMVFNYVRDTMNELFAHIERLAKLGESLGLPDIETEELLR